MPTWMIVILIAWPLVALPVGVLVGRSIALTDDTINTRARTAATVQRSPARQSGRWV